LNVFIDDLESFSNAPVDIDKELFLWSVINKRTDFSLLFWSRTKNKICKSHVLDIIIMYEKVFLGAALVAALIYKKYGREFANQNYLNSAAEFEQLAVITLEKFYSFDANACIMAIIRQIPPYGNVTCFELALEADAHHFIFEPAVQKVLTNIWQVKV
jgi:transient receptor potential cation channel subfamily M protein 4